MAQTQEPGKVRVTGELQHGRGRPSLLADPEICEQVAAMFANGYLNKDIAEIFDITPVTAGRWRRDIRVKSRMTSYAHDRIQSITKAVDREIEARLADPQELTLKELLEIRKEFLRGLRTDETEVDDGTVVQAMEALENDPGLMDDLKKLLSPKPDGS